MKFCFQSHSLLLLCYLDALVNGSSLVVAFSSNSLSPCSRHHDVSTITHIHNFRRWQLYKQQSAQQRHLSMKYLQQLVLRGGAHESSSTSATRMQESLSSETTTTHTSASSWTSRVVTTFLRLLFKGMTLPFPMLRELANLDDTDSRTNNDGQQAATLGFSLRECVLAIWCYLCLGTLAFSVLFEKWSVTDSLYFSVVTFTSVGYGDLTPTTLAGKWFTCVFGLSGLAFLGAAISTIGTSLLGKEKALIQAAEEASRNRMKNVFEGMPHIVKSLRTTNTNNDESTTPTTTIVTESGTNSRDDYRINTEQQNTPVGWRASVQKAILKLVPSLSFLWVGGMIMARIEGWKWTDSVYYSIITGSTIGYGDFFPKTPLGRAWGVLFIPLAVAAAGDVLGNVGSTLVERRQAKVFEELMNRDITMENLLAMDEDDSGKVSREEYVRFMLTEMGLVEAEELDALYDQFERLDADGSGFLDKADLELMARHRSVNETNSCTSLSPKLASATKK